MCGRFALIHAREEIERVFAVAGVEAFPPRYNIAPTQPVLVVTAGPARPEGSNLPDREAGLMRWGLLPSWVRDSGDFPLLINARSETAASKASFRAAMRHRRCLVPASGFYEWPRAKATCPSQPWWVRPVDGGPVGFAGLHETWIGKDGSEIDTCAILTTAAPADLVHIHDRVPVPLKPEDHARWLDCRANGPVDVAGLLAPPAPGTFEAVAVSDRVNKVANTGPELLEPVAPGEQSAKPAAGDAGKGDDGQFSLF